VSKKELVEGAGEGWSVEPIEGVQVGVRADLKEMTFSQGGPRA
jgi:hypothetical protein